MRLERWRGLPHVNKVFVQFISVGEDVSLLLQIQNQSDKHQDVCFNCIFLVIY